MSAEIRRLIDQWTAEAKEYARGSQMDSPVGDMNRASATVVRRFLSDLEALLPALPPDDPPVLVAWVFQYLVSRGIWFSDPYGPIDGAKFEQLQADAQRALPASPAAPRLQDETDDKSFTRNGKTETPPTNPSTAATD